MADNTQQPRRFLNPYQFVREQEVPQTTNNELKPLVRDRWVSHHLPPASTKSGTITCRLTTKTPLLMAHHEENGGLTFVKNAEEQYYLPASSLRGAIRSVFEAATNSCYTFPAQDPPIFYRNSNLSKEKQIVPGMIQKNEDGKFVFHPLPGTISIESQKKDKRINPDNAAWLNRYSNSINQGRPLITDTLVHGKEYYAILQETKHVKNSTTIPIWAVVAINESEEKLGHISNPADQIKVKGYYYQTALRDSKKKNFYSKHDERFFFSHVKKGREWPEWPLESTIITRYHQLIEDSNERLSGKLSNSTTSVSDFVNYPKEWEVREGVLLYGVFDANFTQLLDLVPVLMPRLAYHHSYQSLIPKAHQHCESIDALCPTCRIFGWVKGTMNEHTGDAYASRLRWTDGVLTTSHRKPLTKIKLKPLGSPHPSAVGFYLRSKTQNKPFTWTSKENPPYDRTDDETLAIRGRKFYYHHPQSNEEIISQATVPSIKADEKSKQNNGNMTPTVEYLEPSVEFEFQIDFRNLLPVELGALLWSLQLEKGWFHQIGYAKPFGFGNVEIRISQLEFTASSLAWDDHEGILSREQEDRYIDDFKSKMRTLYQKESWGEISFIKELQLILGNKRKDNIHYPRPYERTDRVPNEEFRWFSKAKKDGVAWLPLVDSDGLNYQN